jgi:putative addiction module CopG family antidote
MNAHISEKWEPFVRSQVQSGRYASADAVIDEALRLLNERDQGQAEPKVTPSSDDASQARKPVWERILEMTADIPAEEWDKLPADLSEQHDHYIYGTPKRPRA